MRTRTRPSIIMGGWFLLAVALWVWTWSPLALALVIAFGVLTVLAVLLERTPM